MLSSANRKTNRKFPARLDSLTPRYLKTVPIDLFTGKPFRYKPSRNGYLLYSVGQNMKDDAGKSTVEKADDIAIRMTVKR